MDKSEFSIAYDGPALSEYTMDVKDLGPALLAIGHLCSEASRFINGDDVSDIQVRVKTTAPGSFDVILEFVQNLVPVAPIAGIKAIQDAKAILDLLGFGQNKGLLHLLQFLRGERPKDRREGVVDGDQNTTIITNGDNNQIEVHTHVWDLAVEPKIRKALRDTLDPLLKEGIDELEARNRERITIRVSKEEVEKGYYDLIPHEIVTPPTVKEEWLELRRPIFVENSNWQFFHGNKTIPVAILDSEFKEKVFVRKTQRFGVGDQLRVRLRTTELLKPDGNLKREYEILEVLEIKTAAEQQDWLDD